MYFNPHNNKAKSGHVWSEIRTLQALHIAIVLLQSGSLESPAMQYPPSPSRTTSPSLGLGSASGIRYQQVGVNSTMISWQVPHKYTKIGGWVRSDYTPDGYILDRGFAIFIQEYPTSKQLLCYNSLQVKQFPPGAWVKLSGREELAAVSDVESNFQSGVVWRTSYA